MLSINLQIYQAGFAQVKSLESMAVNSTSQEIQHNISLQKQSEKKTESAPSSATSSTNNIAPINNNRSNYIEKKNTNEQIVTQAIANSSAIPKDDMNNSKLLKTEPEVMSVEDTSIRCLSGSDKVASPREVPVDETPLEYHCLFEIQNPLIGVKISWVRLISLLYK